MKIKKLLVLLLSGMMIISFAACGGSSYSHSVTLTYRGWDSANSRYEWTTTTYVSGLTTGGRYTVHW